jgi:PIN domain nuclease of toxin-antitoxin system
VSVLLDTCALLALARGVLPEGAVAALRSAPEAFVSAVSAWEVAIKVSSGRLVLRQAPREWFHGLADAYDLREVPLDAATACAAAALPPIHRDPFDRVLVALARARGVAILTSDRDIPRYPDVSSVW